MSREIIARAVDLANKGVHTQAMDLLRPLLLDEKMKASALVTMAYCLKCGGNFAAAVYACGEAVRLVPANTKWSEMVAQLEEARKKRITDAQLRRPRGWLKLIGFLLLLIGGLGIAVALVDVLSDFVFNNLPFEINPSRYMVEFVSGGAATVILGLILFRIGMVRKSRYKKALREAEGEDFLDPRHFPCWACGLRRAKKPEECFWCSSPRKRPKGVRPVVVEPAAPFPTAAPAPLPLAMPEAGLPSDSLPAGAPPPLPAGLPLLVPQGGEGGASPFPGGAVPPLPGAAPMESSASPGGQGPPPLPPV